MKRLEEIKRLLIVVDMVNGFVKAGALADPYIQTIIPKIKKIIEEIKKDPYGEIAFIRDAHNIDCAEFNKFPKHCVDGTWESEIISELVIDDARIYKKNSRNFMYSSDFITDLEKLEQLKKVIITGCCTDLCVLDGAISLVNYFDQTNREIEIIVPEDAVETYDAPSHDRKEYNSFAKKLLRQEGIKVKKDDKYV